MTTRFASILIFLFFPLTSFAWNVVQVNGDVHVRHGDKDIPATGVALSDGDVVVTGKQSKALLQNNESRLWLGSNTKFKIQPRQESSQPQTLDLLVGKLRAVVNKADAPNFRYKTPSAVSGVRGTEFFLSAEDNKDTVCTLEGLVEVQSSNGKKYDVKAGKGLELSPGQKAQLSDNSPFLVDEWVAETSFDQPEPISSNLYVMNATAHRLKNDNWFVGGSGHIFYCDSQDRDFNSSQKDPHNSCTRAYVSPFIQYGVQNKLFFRPAFVAAANRKVVLIDDVPETFTYNINQLTVAEAYGETELAHWTYRAGYQQIEWADGVLLSKRMWSNEPVTHLALDAKGAIAEWPIEFLLGKGITDHEALRGHSHISTIGAKADLPQTWGQIYLLHADFGDLDSSQSPMYHGHQLMNYGFYSTHKLGLWDYKFSAIYQKHIVHHFMNGMPGSVDGNMFDVAFGRQISKFRFSLRYLRASENFIPVLEDYYVLGASNIVSTRANLEQERAKLEWQPRDGHVLSLEYIDNYEVDSDGFVQQLGATGKNLAIGHELDLIYALQLTSQWHLFAGGWKFDPSINQAGRDPAYGWFSRAEFAY